jgi:hypothetical protein
MNNESEVARLRAQIEAEQESAQRAMRSPAYGTAKHRFINARMERMGALHDALKAIVGEEQAAQILAEAMDTSGEEKS